MLNDILLIMPMELLLTVILFILLIGKLAAKSGGSALPWIQFLLLANLLSGFLVHPKGQLFAGLYQTNELISFQKSLLNGSVYLISILFTGWLKKSEHVIEFFILMLAALLGMHFMLSSGNLLMFYLALELSTIPLAALVNFDMHRRRSSEAAIKMVYGSAFSSALMLFGISFIYGQTGSLSLSMWPMHDTGLMLQPMMVVGCLLFLGAFAFKLSVVPFHFWTGDVYEGAPVPVAAFLSVTSKAAAAFTLIRLLNETLIAFTDVWKPLWMILGAATILLGNLFAMRQENMKRFLAFSSVAQIGFVLLGMIGVPIQVDSSITYFLLIYIFSNLAAFAVVDVIAANTGKERIEDYKGLYKSNPFLSWMLAIALFSLAGIPPTAGFFGKLFLLTSPAYTGHYGLLIFAALNMMVSLYFYLRVIRAIFMDKPHEEMVSIPMNASLKFGLIVSSIATISIGMLYWIFDHISSLLTFH
jgi:NADH-quinone oxidoreductase subunit N